MDKAVRQELESAGWRLSREDQPGIYTRVESVLANDSIDWASEPTDMLRDLERVRARRKRNIRRKRHKKEGAFNAPDVVEVI